MIVLIVSSYIFSSKYSSKYPIEESTDSLFACDVNIRNAKFSTTVQKVAHSRHSTKDIDQIFDLLESQLFTLNVHLIQTAFICSHPITVHRLIGSTISTLPISNCQKTLNNTILSLSIPLPTQTIYLQISLFGAKTIGAISLGLRGPSNTSDNGR